MTRAVLLSVALLGAGCFDYEALSRGLDLGTGDLLAGDLATVDLSEADLTKTGLERDLIGRWRFDELAGSIAADSSGLGHDMTLMGGAVFGLGRKTDQGALQVNGIDAYAFAGPTNDHDMPGAGTVALWVNLNSDGSMFTGSALAGRLQGSGLDDAWSLGYRGDTAYVACVNTSELGGNACPLFGPAPNTEYTYWHHLAFTFEGGTARVYRDGAYWTTGLAPVPIGSPMTKLVVGAGENNGQINEFSDGRVSDLRIWRRALTDDEIELVYNEQP